ncbi:MAG: hypothetical protein Kow0047_15860 [Anaerolineae bacterium]
MASFTVMAKQAFRRAWTRLGGPRMAVVPPVSEWTLPDGYAYDQATDTVRNAAGDVLLDPSGYYAAEYIDVVPATPGADVQALVAAGVVPEGQMEVMILGDDLAVVQNAHAVEIDGDWYDVVEVAHTPAGIGKEQGWARVRLQRRS